MEDRIQVNYLIDLEDLITSKKQYAKENLHPFVFLVPATWNAHKLMTKYPFYE